MSGHSKWSTIKRKKGANDAARGKVFSRISKEIMIAVREGGSDVNANTRLRTAMIKASAENMPNSNVERAIKKAHGATDASILEEFSYEGYAPGGVAVMVKCLSDNKNRTGPEVRHVFTKNGGNLGEDGCVSYMFERKGIILVEKNDINEDEFFEWVIDAGAMDVQDSQEVYEVDTSAGVFNNVVALLQEKQCVILHAEISLVPDLYVKLEDNEARETVIKLIEQMEDLDDIQFVAHNLELNTDE